MGKVTQCMTLTMRWTDPDKLVIRSLPVIIQSGRSHCGFDRFVYVCLYIVNFYSIRATNIIQILTCFLHCTYISLDPICGKSISVGQLIFIMYLNVCTSNK